MNLPTCIPPSHLPQRPRSVSTFRASAIQMAMRYIEELRRRHQFDTIELYQIEQVPVSGEHVVGSPVDPAGEYRVVFCIVYDRRGIIAQDGRLCDQLVAAGASNSWPAWWCSNTP